MMGLKPAVIAFFICTIIKPQVAPDVDPCDDQRLDKSYLYSKESAFDGSHLFWGPGLGSASSSHLQYWESVPGNGRLVMYLRDVTIDAEGPRYGSSQLEALRFTGQRSSYATVPHDGNAAGGTEDVQADQHFTWYMEVKPASSGLGQGVLLEYSDCYNPLRVEQVDGVDIRVTVGDNLGQTHTLLAAGVLGTSGWTRLAITYKFDEVDLKIIDFPIGDDPVETLLPVCNVDRSRRMNATGDVRIGASFNPELPNFNGSLSCIQFFRGYLLKNHETVPEFCDPNLSRADLLNVKEYLKDEDPIDLIAARPCPYDEVTTEGPTTETATTEMSTTEALTTEITTTEVPTTEIPTTEIPTTEIPTTEVPTTEIPTTEIPTTEIPTTEVPTTEIPTTEIPTTEVPTTEILTTEVPTTETATTEMPITEALTTEIPTTEVPTKEIPTTEISTTEVPTTEIPTTEIPTTEVPTTEIPTTEIPTTEVPTTEIPTTEIPTTEIPTTEVPTTEIPTTEIPTTEIPTTEIPTTEIPTTRVPTTEIPTTEIPTTEVPTTEILTTEVPTTEIPTTEIPTTGVPTTEIPTTKMPTTEILTTEVPTTEIPTTEIPTTEIPTTVNVIPTTETTTDMPIATVTITPGVGPSEALLQLMTPTESCASFGLLWSNVDLDPALPLLSTELAQNIASCARICFTTPPCSAMGFDGKSCQLTTATDLSSAAFHTSGAYNFFLMD